MGMKRQEHTVNSKRHVSHQVLSTDCCGESTNAEATLPSCSVGSRNGEHRKIVPRTSFSTEKFWAKKIKKWLILTSLAKTVTWPPPVPLWGSSCDSLQMWFEGGHLSSWLDKLTWQAVTWQVIRRGAGGEGDKSTWQSQLVKLTCQGPLVLKNKCRTLSNMLRSKFEM